MKKQEQKITKAIEYAEATSLIENIKLESAEKEMISKVLKKEKQKSCLFNIELQDKKVKGK